MAPVAAGSWQVQRRRSSGSTPSRGRAAHLIGVYVKRSAGELGITQAEAHTHVLAELHRHGPTQIATPHREFGHKRSTLTSILDRLERLKLIRREVNPDDRRSFVIHLTASGTGAASGVTDALDELERSLRRALDSNGLSLQTVTEAIEAAIRDHAASSHVTL
jgi:DNA-binding MarR family transcriptional regulator